MTNGWTDIRNADVVLAMGGNPAENHPVGFRFVMEAKRNRSAKLVCVDPRFNRTAAVADQFVQIRVGTDIAFLGGLIHHALSRNRFHADYVRASRTPISSDTYAFDARRACLGLNERLSPTPTLSWGYQRERAATKIRRCSIRDHAAGDEDVLTALHAGAVANICAEGRTSIAAITRSRRSRGHDHSAGRTPQPPVS